MHQRPYHRGRFKMSLNSWTGKFPVATAVRRLADALSSVLARSDTTCSLGQSRGTGAPLCGPRQCGAGTFALESSKPAGVSSSPSSSVGGERGRVAQRSAPETTGRQHRRG